MRLLLLRAPPSPCQLRYRTPSTSLSRARAGESELSLTVLPHPQSQFDDAALEDERLGDADEGEAIRVREGRRSGHCICCAPVVGVRSYSGWVRDYAPRVDVTCA